MKNQKKNSLTNFLVIIVVIVLAIQLVILFELLYPSSSLKIGSGNSTLTITASGSATAVPTQGLLYVSLKGLGKTAAAATANLSQELVQANATLYKYINGNLSNVQTSYYNLYNQSSYYYPPVYKNNTLNGYQASESLTVTIPNIKNVSAALGALSAINGISIYGASPQFSNSQTSALRITALSNAMSNATAQAHALLPAKTLTVVNITVNYFNRILPYPVAAGGAAVTSSSLNVTNPNFYSGSQSVTESITVVFSYRKNQ